MRDDPNNSCEETILEEHAIIYSIEKITNGALSNEMKMAIATALPGLNGLERWVTPVFLSRNRFYSPHRPKMNKKST